MKGSFIRLSFSFVPSLSYVLLQSTCQAQPDTPQEDEEFIVSDAAMNLRKPTTLRYTVCTDLREACAEWAQNDACHTNPAYMGPHCPVSCHTCHLLQPRTTNQPFGQVIPQRVHASGWEFPDAVGRDLGVPQIIYDRAYSDQIRERIQQARSVVERDATCRNHNIHCTTWAVEGECETNPDYMRQYCAPVCGVCERTTE